MKPTSPKMILKITLFSSDVFSRIFPSLVKISKEKFPWNKTDKTPTFTAIPPHVTILTMLEAIRTPQDGILDEVLGNIVAELKKRRTFGGFREERMKSLLEGTWNKVDCALKDSLKASGQL